MTQQELDQLQTKTLEQFKSGQSLFGADGAFAPMLKQFLEAALQAEMDAHLGEAQRAGGNKRNGKGTKTIKSAEGTFQIQTPEDRQSSFAPQIIKKRETILADNLADKIIGLYGMGMGCGISPPTSPRCMTRKSPIRCSQGSPTGSSPR